MGREQRDDSLPALTDDEKLPHSAVHTLKFMLVQCVDADDNAPSITCDRILKATRKPRTSLYSWVDSFTVHMLRHSERTARRITRKKRTKFNKITSKQITEDEMLIITTINLLHISAYIYNGHYKLGDLIKLLAQHTSNVVAKCYIHTECPQHPRII
jgi:hypothetical protein